MSFNDFKKLFDEIPTPLNKDGGYSLKKGKIIQDDIGTNKDKDNDNKTNIKFKDLFFKLLNHIKSNFNKKNFAIKPFKSIDWSDAGHRTAKILISIKPIFVYIIPLLLMVYGLAQVGLFISKNILPFTPKFDWGWNNSFIQHLPIVFQPTEKWFGQTLLTIITFGYGYGLLEDNSNTQKNNNLVYAYLIPIILVIGLFAFPLFLQDISAYIITGFFVIMLVFQDKMDFNIFNHSSPSDYFAKITNDICDFLSDTVILFAFGLIGYCLFTPMKSINFYLIGSIFVSMIFFSFLYKRFYIKENNVCPHCCENNALNRNEVSRKLISSNEYNNGYEIYIEENFACIAEITCDFCDYISHESYQDEESTFVGYTEAGLLREENRRHEQEMKEINEDRLRREREEHERQEEADLRNRKEANEDYFRRKEEYHERMRNRYR